MIEIVENAYMLKHRLERKKDVGIRVNVERNNRLSEEPIN